MRTKNGTEKKGGTRRIGDSPVPCTNPNHYPPTMIVLRPGTYEHTCPACGHVTVFEVPNIVC